MDSYGKEATPMQQHLTQAIEEKLQASDKRKLDPFANAIQIKLISAYPEKAEGMLTVSPMVLNPYGNVHGGCLSALADTVCGHNLAASGFFCVTMNSTMNYLRPATGKFIYCSSRPQKLGNKVCVTEMRQTDDQGNLICTGIFTFFVVSRQKPHIIEPGE